MFLTAKKVAFSGIILAVSFILLQLGSLIEVSTLFFLAAAAFCIGIMIREFGIKAGAAFFVASLMLGFFLAPNKLYVLTYGAIQIYLLLRELLWEKCFEGREMAKIRLKYFFVKFLIYQILFLPLFFFAREIFLGEDVKITPWLLLPLGEVLWLIIDAAYDVFQSRFWEKIRRQLDWLK